MKKYIKCILRFILKIIAKCFPFDFLISCSHVVDFVFSQWISFKFKFIGNNSIIQRGCHIDGFKYIKIGNNVSIRKNCVISAWDFYEGIAYSPSIVLGDNCSIGEYNHISSIDSVYIGNGVLTGRYVYISDNNHGDSDYDSLSLRPAIRKLSSKGPVVICDNVWIGDKATILSGVKIGESSIIAANSVVTHDVPPFSVVGGVPAKIIKNINLEH